MEIWKKQKKILTAFGIFLGLMFMCTLISRVVYASRLPQVTVDTPSRMAINHTVEAEGIVSQGREYAVTSLAGLRVRTVYTYVGERVTPETLLFDLDTEDLKKKIEEQELAIKKIQLQMADLEQNRNLNTQKQQTDSVRAQEDYNRAANESEEALKRAEDDLDDAEDALEAHRKNGVSVTSEEDRKAAQAAYEEWAGKEGELKAALEQAQKEYEAAQAEVHRLNEEQKAQGQPGTGGSADEEENSSAGPELSDALDTARQKEAEAKEKYDSAQSAYQSHLSNSVPKPDFTAEDEAKAAWNSRKESLKDAVDAAERAVEDAEQSQSDTMLEAGRKVADANTAVASDSSLEISRLELASLKKELAAYKKVLEASGQVYPEAEGIITRVQVSPGERVSDGAAVVYADLSSPMQFHISLTKEQKKYVNQGDQAELSLGGSAKEDVTVDYVTESEAVPDMYDAYVFLPKGTGTMGQSGTFKVKAQSETYSLCIPIDALYEDSNKRNYVYIVSEKAGILGKELAAEKIYVKVLDKNDSYAAIEEGVIDRETELILTSTEVLEDRDVIRYKE